MECVINPERGRGEAAISGAVLVCPNPGEALALGRLAKLQGWQQHFLYNSTRWSRPDSGASICGPAVGAPMAVLTLEKLIALGGQRFVVFGTCGALSPALTVGDVLLPTWAVSEEGTSRHYPLPLPPRPSATLQGVLTDVLMGDGIDVKPGGLWTTDAPYRERRDRVRQYQSQEVLAIDMEFSALITVAAFRQVELAAVMVVSDLLYGDIWQPGFASRPCKGALRAVSQTLFAALSSGRFSALDMDNLKDEHE